MIRSISPSRHLLGVAMVAALLACARQSVARSDRSGSALEARVYAALIDSLYWRPVPETLLVTDSTLVSHVQHGGVAEWRVQYDSIPESLPTALENLSRSRIRTTALSLPRPVYVVTRATLNELFARGPRDGWVELSRRYPAQRGYLQLSPVAFSGDSLDALVEYGYHCGGLCGEGNVVWLTRRGVGRWRVRKVVRLWVS